MVSAKVPSKPQTSVVFPDKIKDISIFSYDGSHREFYQELIAKANKLFGGTSFYIPTEINGRVKSISPLERFGLITTIYKNPQLRSHNFWPITPTQSEHLVEAGVFAHYSYPEGLGLLLYNTSPEGYNPQESKALRNSLQQHKQELGLSNSDLKARLVIVNPGIEEDFSMPYGLKPIVLPGVTKAYTHEVLEKAGERAFYFNGYGLKGGLPLLNQLDRGSRILYIPSETKIIGLRALFRYRNLNLDSWVGSLFYSGADCLVTFAPQGATPC